MSGLLEKIAALSVDDIWSTMGTQLAIVFFVYIIIILLFARLYYWLYKKDPGSFAFNTEVLKKQSTSFKLRANNAIEKKKRELKVLEDLQAAMDTPAGEIVRIDRWYQRRKRSALTLDDRKYIFETYTTASAEGAPPRVNYDMEIQWKNKDLIEVYRLPSDIGLVPDNLVQGKLLVKNWKEQITNQIDKFEQQLRTLESQPADVWTFFDFMYFSLISQTTVGYGDMLPNSTSVRMLVTTQVLTGYAMLVIVLNVALSH